MANVLGMKFRLLLVVVTALAVGFGAAPAGAAGENPYWRVDTNLPVESVRGEWSVAGNGRSATVEFEGANVVGQTTKFTAGWRTGWFKASQGQDGEFSYLIDPVTTGDLKPMVRVQAKRGRWSPWFKGRMPMTNSGGTYVWGVESVGRPIRAVRYEWRLVGTINGNAYIEGSATITVH